MKTKGFLQFSIIMILVLMTLSPFSANAQSPQVLYVVQGGSTSGLCDNWDNACDLQYALTSAVSDQEIWVAAGVYKPDTEDRTATFQLKSGVGLYGGFYATETTRDQRDWQTNVTILSGDIGNQGDVTDNSYHVVTARVVDTTAVLDGFTITAGNANGAGNANCDSWDASGGGMLNLWGSPTLTNVTFSSNIASGGGAGMINYGGSNPVLVNVAFISNSTTGDGGGICNIYSSSPSLTNVTFISNSAENGGGMFNYYANSSNLVNVTFNGNSATANGGGMYNSGSSPSLTNITFNANTSSNGGGMYNYGSSPSLTTVTFSDNISTINGGGMYNFNSSPSLNNVTLSGNTAFDGGGMYTHLGDPILTNVTFNNNVAVNYGGGMENEFSNSILVNVTFNDNSATTFGGGMFNAGGNPSLTNVTFNSNTATDGGGMSNHYYSHPVIRNSIFWGNGTEIFNGGVGVETSPSLIDDSLIQGGCPVDSICNANILNTDPLLSTLANNGGFTQTMALSAGSPAINTGNNATCATTDQRGVTRPQGIHCDMGAYEYEGPFNEPPVIVALTAPLNPVEFGQSIDAMVEFSDPDISDTHTITWNWGDGATTTGSSAFESHLYAQPGVYTITVTVTDVGELSDIATTTVTVSPWTLKGFYQPVDMNGVYNIAKNGSTIPFKFEIFADSTELTDIAYIKSIIYAPVSCATNAATDDIETTAMGGTSLRYDVTAGQFIYNWKTPNNAGKCYRVTMITIDGSSLVAYFKLK